jgi:hypothetical protein
MTPVTSPGSPPVGTARRVGNGSYGASARETTPQSTTRNHLLARQRPQHTSPRAPCRQYPAARFRRSAAAEPVGNGLHGASASRQPNVARPETTPLQAQYRHAGPGRRVCECDLRPASDKRQAATGKRQAASCVRRSMSGVRQAAKCVRQAAECVLGCRRRPGPGCGVITPGIAMCSHANPGLNGRYGVVLGEAEMLWFCRQPGPERPVCLRRPAPNMPDVPSLTRAQRAECAVHEDEPSPTCRMSRM